MTFFLPFHSSLIEITTHPGPRAMQKELVHILAWYIGRKQQRGSREYIYIYIYPQGKAQAGYHSYMLSIFTYLELAHKHPTVRLGLFQGCSRVKLRPLNKAGYKRLSRACF